ncbi:WD repeat and FYVE domain-containing protein 3-like isoform X2 [Gigantopelta aegis]|uniref:WD repeat and FYVE domain-containing protein 3-like isoform X2 n=1 Tax=Gigantopelta aegis TaxID=1735272 RepID=UPI001B889DC5|nr:WD repeat and FYVE domain-containing protein 3-like isoform X2 [Gigantopelta aegis]
MSFMKKLVGMRSGSDARQSHVQDNSLGLMHLRKLFAEFRHPAPKATQKDQEDKLYTMLPLFCKVFENAPANEMTEKWGDILQFCSHVSKLMVTEIRRRASNQSTEAASCAIVRFLEIESSEDNSNGWTLLSTINLLSVGDQALIDCMTAASLPSTLVKCLYLFFDLPLIPGDETVGEGCEFTTTERRVLLQKVFVQVLVRLCNHVSPAEELARKDDLSLLFSAITSVCPPQNVPWRKSAAEVLVTLSRHGLSPPVVKYIHEKGCVRHCLENMQRLKELSPLELVEMFVTCFCFLKDSSEVSQVLLDDFRAAQGYVYLSEFLLRLEQDPAEETQQALRNLVLLVGSLTTCGFTELKPTPASTGSLFQMPGFSTPQPAGKDNLWVSVRNLHAFQVLQSVFLKSNSIPLCSTILDVISSIYHQDNANFFILESQHTLSQFAEKIYLKPVDIQTRFFELMEFIVFNLNFVPCKELISLSILVKSQHSIECSILCMKTLLRILRYHSVYRDVFREVGMLEVMVSCLHRYAALLKEPQDPASISAESEKVNCKEEELGHLVMEALTLLLSGNSSNASVFRECGGARCAHNMVPYVDCRQQALNIVQQLVLSPGGDDDMGTLLGLMPTAPIVDLDLKTHILKSLLNVLRESHRTRTVFRKVGGFVYVMSVLVSMEGCLANPPKSPWHEVNRKDILTMLRTVFSTLTVAMRYEPANAKFFATEVRYDSLTEAIRLLGCFSSTMDIQPAPEDVSPSESLEHLGEFFCHTKEERLQKPIPVILLSCCLLVRYLYDMALDAFDKPITSQLKLDGPSARKQTLSVSDESQIDQSPPRPKRGSTGSMVLNLNSHSDLVIVHSGAVLSMFHLLPAIEYEPDKQNSLDLRLFAGDILKSLLRTERNQQIMCDGGFPHELLSHGSVALVDESHPLHPALQYMFERLASQSLTPRDLRDFLRLGSPLSCRSVDDTEDSLSIWEDPMCIAHSLGMEDKQSTVDIEKKLQSAGGTVPLTRVKCLVSMTTPRDARMHGATVTPAFVEFDMSAEGFACLYLPSIAPQGPPTPSVVGGVVGTSEPVVIGGVGSGERVFPPQSGLTFSTWFCVDKFSMFSTDAHPVRLLTIVRNLQGRDENLICLSVTLASRDRALIVATQETYMPNSVSGCEQEQDVCLNDNTVRFWCPELTQEGQWHHLVLIFHRAGIMKNSSVSLFIDGLHANTQKLHYISPNLGGGGTASPTAFTSVFAYIGTPPQLRHNSRLIFRQGPCHLLEDIVSSTIVQHIYNLGPTYIGSFQAAVGEDGEVMLPFIGEEKVMFGVHAHAMSQMTIAKIRKVYNKVDSKSIAKQLAMSAHENATPIRILHNSAGHLGGAARTLGAILMGYLGVRTFCPRPVAKMLDNIGGTSALLGLIAMAKDVEGLYAAVKAIVCVVRSHKSAMWDMDRIRGYQLLAMLYKKKKNLLNSHILHLTFSLVGTVDSGRESSGIPNRASFEDLLCDVRVWHDAPGELERSLYDHFRELLTESGESKMNHAIMRDIGLVSRLLHILADNKLSTLTIHTIATVVKELLLGPPEASSLLRFGQFLVSTIPATSCSEKNIKLDTNNVVMETSHEEYNQHHTQNDVPPDSQAHTIRLRNILLDIVNKIIVQGNNTINQQMCDEVEKVLGFDWLLLFMQSHLHPTTVISALHILVTILRIPSNVTRFREGNFGGGWLGDTESVLKNQMAAMLGFNLGVSAKGHQREVNHEVCHVPGFLALQWLLPHHNDVSAIYFFLMALLLGQHVKELPTDVELNLDAIWSVIFGVPASTPVSLIAKEKVELVPDAALVILAMIRSMLNQEEEKNCSSQDFSITLMQFLMFLYHNQQDFQNLCMGAEFISGLAATLFPMQPQSIDSDLTSPQEEFKPFPDSEPVVVIKTPEKTCASFLTGHQARKFIFDFLRTLVIDSFNQSNSAKASVIIDLVIDAFPDHASRAQQKEYQTEILTMLMEHLLAADVLLGDQAAMPMAAGTSYSSVAHNVFYFASRVVDKLWQGSLQLLGSPVSSHSACSAPSLTGFSHGMFTREAKEVFEFISRLISQSKRKSSGVSLDPIYKCLNRTILFQLSRPIDSVTSQASVLEALHKLTNSRSLVFGPGNYDQEFLGCLCYCLLQLTEDPQNSAANLSELKPRMTTWHCDPDASDSDSPGSSSNSLATTGRQNSVLEQGMHVVAVAAKRVWDELYICKKPALEEIFRTSLNSINSSTKNISAPDLNAVRLLIQEQASKIWVTYAENERKTSFMPHDKLQTQIQSVSGKLQRVGSGVLKFARKTKRDLPLKTSPASTVHVHDFHLWTTNHVTLVKDVVEFQHKQYQESQEHMDKYLLEEWQQMEEELLRVRGLWGPNNTYRLDKWMLDMTEGPCRMRKKMMQNNMFFVHYPYRPDLEDSPLRYKVAISFDSKEFCEHYRPQSILGLESLPIKRTGDADVLVDEIDSGLNLHDADIMSMPKLLPRSTSQRSGCDDEDQDDVPASELPGESEKVEGQSENQQEGQQEGQTTTGERGGNQAILRILGEKEKISHMFRCARIQGLDTSEGLLLFGKEHFYVIDGFTLLKTREIKDIDTLPPGYHDPIIPRSSMSSGGTMKRMCSKFAYVEVREVLKRRYLLQPIAIEIFSADGRNYLLAFPRKTRNKVYAKCMSVATSITDDAHRSVSGQKQNAKVESAGGLISSLIGEKSVTQRWERGEINNFQYLMHLNTLAGRCYNDLMQYPVFPWIIADYDSEDLDLSNPATFRDLSRPMGGQSPDRLKQFEKRYNEWDDPQGETPPYHYGTHYSSAMIVASYLVRMEPFTQHFLKLQGGHFDLADRMFHSVRENWMSASKHNMADVKELIPEFFYLPDMLCNKNSFDLGCKQSGIELNDVLLPTWAKGDPREFIRAHREALECDMVSAHLHEWIDLIFGYKQRGPPAVEAVNVFHHLFYEGNVDIYSIDDPLKKNATIGFINNFGQIPKALFKRAHPQKKLNIRLLDPLPMGSYGSTNDKLFFHNVDNLKPSMQPIKELKSATGCIFQNDKNVLAVEQNKVLIPPNFNKYLAWGYSDLSVRIGNYDSDRATAVFECLDNGEILCAACPNEKIFITGGFSCVVNVWEYVPKDRKAVLKRPLYGHTEPVTCLAASQAYNVIVSGSRDRTCIIWDLSRLIFVHQLRGHVAPVAAVTINDLTGDIATCSGTYLHFWNINGEEIASTNTSTGRNQQILCVAMSQMMEWDSQNVILVGSSDGVVRMWSVEYVQVPVEVKAKIKDVTDVETSKTDGSTSSSSPTAAPAINIPKRKMSRHGSCDSYNEARPAMDLLKDFKDPDYLVAKEMELGSSADSETHYINRIKTRIPTVKAGQDKDVEEVFSRLDSNLSTASSASDLCKGEDGASVNSDIEELSAQEVDSSSIRFGDHVDTAVDAVAELNEAGMVESSAGQHDPSCPNQLESNHVLPGADGVVIADGKSQVLERSGSQGLERSGSQGLERSGSPGFEVIGETEVQNSKKTMEEMMRLSRPSGKHHLREGFVWQRQLVFRSKLTMHTAFERKDNKDPAAITAITISKDHKTVYVGDARGRVFSWTVTDQPGRVVADHWMKDEGTDSCLSCNVKFSFAERRHHCRNCGQVFCSRCSRYETEIRRLHILRPVRVCQSCYSSVRAQQVDTAANQRT